MEWNGHFLITVQFIMNRVSQTGCRKIKLLKIVFLLTQIFAASINRPKIGLVLSCGRAGGYVHIGTLKLLDSLQIPIDYIGRYQYWGNYRSPMCFQLLQP